MRLSGAIAVSILLIQMSLARSGQAGCPDAITSSASPRLFACPAGDSTFVVITRDFGHNPMPGKWAQLAFRDCDGFRLAPPKAGESFVRDSTGLRIWTGSISGGIAAFSVSGGGACGNGFVDIGMCAGPPDTSLGIPFGTRPLVSPDQNGDLIVDQRDVDLAEAKLGGSDPSADFDGDGQVTAADVQILSAHLGHHAPGVTTAVGPEFPGTLSLSSPEPNPFWRETRFTLTLQDNAAVDFSVYDLGGRRIATVFQGNLHAGSHDFSWRGRDDNGSAARSGIYFALVRVGTDQIARRVAFLGGSSTDAR